MTDLIQGVVLTTLNLAVFFLLGRMVGEISYHPLFLDLLWGKLSMDTPTIFIVILLISLGIGTWHLYRSRRRGGRPRLY